MIAKHMNVCTLGTGYRPITLHNVSKIDVLAVDGTKHMLLSTIHALYMCLIERLEEKEKEIETSDMDPM